MNVRTALALQATRRAITTTTAVSSIRSLAHTVQPASEYRSIANPQPLPSRSFSLTAPRAASSPGNTPMAAQTDTEAASVSSSSNPPITPDFLIKKLKSSLNITHVNIEDMSGGCGQAFNAIIVSQEFDKKTLLARSRLVNSVLKDEIRAIHAWTPRCLTPEQWDKEKERIGE